MITRRSFLTGLAGLASAAALPSAPTRTHTGEGIALRCIEHPHKDVLGLTFTPEQIDGLSPMLRRPPWIIADTDAEELGITLRQLVANGYRQSNTLAAWVRDHGPLGISESAPQVTTRLPTSDAVLSAAKRMVQQAQTTGSAMGRVTRRHASAPRTPVSTGRGAP